jgi:hypothetical protein
MHSTNEKIINYERNWHYTYCEENGEMDIQKFSTVSVVP